MINEQPCRHCVSKNFHPEWLEDQRKPSWEMRPDRAVNAGDGDIDEVVMRAAWVHLEKLSDETFMLIVENKDHHIHMRVGSSSGRAPVRAFVYEEFDQC